jgi:hypothetical protein
MAARKRDPPGTVVYMDLETHEPLVSVPKAWPKEEQRGAGAHS